MDLIEKAVASISIIALGLFTWKSTDGKADAKLMDERHDVVGQALEKMDKKQDTLADKQDSMQVSFTDSLNGIKVELAKMNNKGESDG